jgi:hypothetical protein
MTVTGRPTEQRPALIDIEKLFADLQFSSPSISPDGTRIAYLAPHRGRRNVWVAASTGPTSTRPGHPRHPARDHQLPLDRRPALAAVPAGHRRERGLAPVPGRPRRPGRAGRRPDPARSRVTRVRRRCRDHGARHRHRLDEPRPLYVDVFRIDLSTGRTTPLVERTEPAEFFLLDRAGRGELVHVEGRRRHPRGLRGGPRHRRAAPAGRGEAPGRRSIA